MKCNRLPLILLLILAVPLVAWAAGTEDPYYKQWARFKVGSSVSLTGTAVEGAQAESSFRQTITLKEVKGDYLTVGISRVEGAKKTDKTKKVEKFIDSKTKYEDLGQEEITIAGKKFKCQRKKLTYFYDDGKVMMSFEYWFHPDIPGAAKILSQAPDPSGKAGSKVTQTAVSWQKK